VTPPRGGAPIFLRRTAPRTGLRGVESIDVVNADGSVEPMASMPNGTPVSATEGVRARAIHRDLVELFERVAAKLEAGTGPAPSA
jgi:hypothetical protein